jgi:UDP-N-acetyl-D-mannosaminuronic acid dehydrogenase
MKFDICVIGLGYIGLPTASIFATRGKKVLGVDVLPHVVETINQGKIHIEEPDLDMLVRAAVQSENLKAATAPAEADTYIIAVPTPFLKREDGAKIPDLSYVESATRSIAKVVQPGALVILESTSPVGTTEKMREWLYAALALEGRVQHSSQFIVQSSGGKGPAHELITISDELRAMETEFPLLFAHCPERILPGQMLKELVSNDRIAGGLTPEASERAKALYQTFCTAEIFISDARTAELAKLTENSFRDVNIAFANELSMICDKLGIDVWELITLANRHPRVNILQPGPGVGGHCIAVDPWFIVDAAPEQARLIRTAREVNDHKPEWVIAKIKAKAERFKEPVIACLGLAFKPEVDDLRESPAVEIVAHLAELGLGRILAVEPHVRELPKTLQGKAELVDASAAIRAADIVVLLVNHRVFKSVDRGLLAEKSVIDTRGFWR